MPLAEKGDLLDGVTRTMQEHGADVAHAAYDIWDTTKWLCQQRGHTGSTSTSSSAARR